VKAVPVITEAMEASQDNFVIMLSTPVRNFSRPPFRAYQKSWDRHWGSD